MQTPRPPLRLVRIGEAPLGLVDELALRLRPLLGTPVVVDDEAMDPSFAFDRTRGQTDSRRLMQSLGERVDGDLVLGVADVDLYASIFTFVFGEAHLGGEVALVSLHRLRPELYGLAADRDLTSARLLTEAVHEIGHLRGAVHCSTPGCVMNFSGAVEEIDLKRFRPCVDCSAMLGIAPATDPD